MSECDHEASSGEAVTRYRVAVQQEKISYIITMTYFITMHATGFIRFKILVLFPQDGGQPLKRVGKTTVLL